MRDIRYKAAFFDVDGTILSHRTGEVPDSTLTALRRMREHGVRIVMASGRHPSELKEINIDTSLFDDFITTNGQIVIDHRGRVIADNPLPKDRLSILTETFAERKIPLQFNSMEKLYMNFVDDRVRQVLAEIHTPVHDTGEYEGESLYQVVAYITENDASWVEEVSKSFQVTSWHPNGIDIITQGGGKDWGMRAYLEHTGILREETIAFGDGANDVSMIRFAGMGVAMGNAAPALKEAADLVAEDIDSDGLYKVCERFGLMG